MTITAPVAAAEHVALRDDYDPDWEFMELSREAAYVGALALQGRDDEIETYLIRTNYRARLAMWKARR